MNFSRKVLLTLTACFFFSVPTLVFASIDYPSPFVDHMDNFPTNWFNPQTGGHFPSQTTNNCLTGSCVIESPGQQYRYAETGTPENQGSFLWYIQVHDDNGSSQSYLGTVCGGSISVGGGDPCGGGTNLDGFNVYSVPANDNMWHTELILWRDGPGSTKQWCFMSDDTDINDCVWNSTSVANGTTFDTLSLGMVSGRISESTYVDDISFYAGNPLSRGYTLPMSPTDFSITSWFDHDATSSSMTKYTGTIYTGATADIATCTSGCYDGHHGIDFGTASEGKKILAAADGTVSILGWENPSDHTQGYGYRAVLYHPQTGQSTVYAHATTTQSFVLAGDNVVRGQTILLSGMTGDATGPHLHFGVFDNNSDSDAHAVDPYGWESSTTTDPRANDLGYLWTTNPPSLYDTISSNITSTTTLEGNHNYIISGSVQVNSGVTLTVEPGAVVKFASGASLMVNGSLNAVGTFGSPIYFTSIKDDSIWGDTNNDATTTSPAFGDWSDLEINSNASSSLENVILKYGSISSFGSNGLFITSAH